MIAQPRQPLEGSGAIAERRHVAKVRGVDAMPGRADDFREIRLRVSGFLERFEISATDICEREIHLLLRRRTSNSTPGEVVGEGLARHERERSAANAAAADAVDVERAGLALNRQFDHT